MAFFIYVHSTSSQYYITLDMSGEKQVRGMLNLNEKLTFDVSNKLVA